MTIYLANLSAIIGGAVDWFFLHGMGAVPMAIGIFVSIVMTAQAVSLPWRIVSDSIDRARKN